MNLLSHLSFDLWLMARIPSEGEIFAANLVWLKYI